MKVSVNILEEKQIQIADGNIYHNPVSFSYLSDNRIEFVKEFGTERHIITVTAPWKIKVVRRLSCGHDFKNLRYEDGEGGSDHYYCDECGRLAEKRNQ